MDYVATGKLHESVVKDLIDGFVKGCKQNGCALIGGETAEMPGVYEENKYDLSGTIVGVAERRKLITGKGIKRGDVLLGLPSTGLHTNGYSLARKVLLEKYSVDDRIDELDEPLGDVLLRVHRSYLEIITAIVEKFPVKGLAHITGGGIIGNTMRIIPKGLSVAIDWSAWERAAVFGLIQQVGNVPEDDMRRTFNLGIGLIAIVSKHDCDAIVEFAASRREKCIVMGEVVHKR